jgi:hypothetical protein
LPSMSLTAYRLRRRDPSHQPLIKTIRLPCRLTPIRTGRLD